MLKVTVTPKEIRFLRGSSFDTDGRVYAMIKYLKRWFYRYGKHRITYTSSLILYVSDTYFWEDPDLPLFVFAKPADKQRGGILFPDDHFFCNVMVPEESPHPPSSSSNTAQQKRRQSPHPYDTCLDQDELVRYFTRECAEFDPFDRRSNAAYFRGAATGSTRSGKWGIREFLSGMNPAAASERATGKSSNISMKVPGAERAASADDAAVSRRNDAGTEGRKSGGFELDVRLGRPRVPQSCYCRPKILLNLPGHQPWSYRMRELMLTGSLVVDVAVRVSYDGGKTYGGEWVQWWTPAFKPGRDYVRLVYKFVSSDTHEAILANEKENRNLLSNIHALFLDVERRPSVYQQIAASGRTRMASVTTRMVDGYVEKCFEACRGKLDEVPPAASRRVPTTNNFRK